ncbi:hypothetical protein L2725_20010 [Shewanella corallii]|uniref:TniQ family protein n=1 Tax=Shewanella corallii TaxID=560080 RepID=A0ABT0NC15_9GAMM|nr:hypothetical protein [Shewanella corallii]MCL2916029.1 hypothetical protein [Shewanella corallii]
MNFAVSPTPMSDESLIGYLVRLIHLNGYRYMRRILNKPLINAAVSNKTEEVSNALGRQLPYPNYEVTAINTLWSLPTLTQARICLKCIDEHGYIKAEVQNPFLTHCSQHAIELLDTCPTCNRQLRWETKLIKGHCSECGLRLSTANTPSLPALSQPEVADCLLASAMLEPGEKPYFIEPKLCTLEHIATRVKRGYNLLTSERQFKVWVLKLLRQFPASAPQTMCLYDVEYLFERLQTQWPVQQLRETCYQACYVSRAEPADCPVIPARQAATVLNISLETLSTLTPSQIVRNPGICRVHARTKIDFSPLLEVLPLYSPQEQMVPISNQIKLLQRYDLDLANLLIARCDGKIALAYRRNACFYSSIYCDPKDLVRLGEEELKQRSNRAEVVTLEMAMRLTGLSQEELYCRRKNGFLPVPKYFQSGSNSLFYISDLVKLIRINNKLEA